MPAFVIAQKKLSGCDSRPHEGSCPDSSPRLKNERDKTENLHCTSVVPGFRFENTYQFGYLKAV